MPALRVQIAQVRMDDEPTTKTELSKLMLMVNMMERELHDLADRGLGIKGFEPYETML